MLYQNIDRNPPRLLFVLRRSPDWHGIAADFRRGVPIDPSLYVPSSPVRGIPRDMAALVGRWNEQMGIDFFTCRARLKDLSGRLLGRIQGAHRISYGDIDTVLPDIRNYIVFYHNDDDWFAPDIGQTLQEVLPAAYDACTFPMPRIGTESCTLAGFDRMPAVYVNRVNPPRYYANNYGLSGMTCDGARLLAMRDHLDANAYSAARSLNVAYCNRIVSATLQSPCSVQQMLTLRAPGSSAEQAVSQYVAAIGRVQIPASLPWVADGIEDLVGLFGEVAASVRRPRRKPGFFGGLRSQPQMPLLASVTRLLGKRAQPVRHHKGIQYIAFMKLLAERQAPRSYLEVGTRNGESAAQLDCDVICVDPLFRLTFDIARKRRRTMLFQMTSDAFFETHDVRRFFPNGLDLAFLDGMHLFESLLRDFINTEKYCHDKSIVLLHDCLPFSPDITSRVQKPGAWTGDVWKLLPILRKYRPGLKVVFFDCPPTGLAAVTGLDPTSTVLADAYDRIVADYANVTKLPPALRKLYPYVETRALVAEPEELAKLLPVSGLASPIARAAGALKSQR